MFFFIFFSRFGGMFRLQEMRSFRFTVVAFLLVQRTSTFIKTRMTQKDSDPLRYIHVIITLRVETKGSFVKRGSS